MQGAILSDLLSASGRSHSHGAGSQGGIGSLAAMADLSSKSSRSFDSDEEQNSSEAKALEDLGELWLIDHPRAPVINLGVTD